jgi:L-asparaginase II
MPQSLHGAVARGKVLGRLALRGPFSLVSERSVMPHPPLIIDVTRGTLVESRHRCIAAVAGPDGGVVRSWGDIEQPIYGRSAIKPLLALALVETGAADAFGLGDAEIALACASHSGEPRHVETVRAWLRRIGLSAADLECGAHMPYDEPSMRALVAAGQAPDATHNNCSGKHTGFLTTAVHLGEPTRGYIRYEHPVQQRLLGVLEQTCGLDLSAAPRGVDGCGIPTIGIPLGNTAMAMARLADPVELPPERAMAAKRVVAAMMAEPYMVGGRGEFASVLMEGAAGKLALKPGAEGVYAGILPGLGLGICVKAEDGTSRAAQVAVGQILEELGVFTAAERRALADRLTPPVLNRIGLEVGRIRPAEMAAF